LKRGPQRLLRLDAQHKIADSDSLIRDNFDRLTARNFLSIDKGRIAALRGKVVTTLVGERQGGVDSADLRIAFDWEGNRYRTRTATDGDLVLENGHYRLSHAVAPDLNLIEDAGPSPHHRLFALDDFRDLRRHLKHVELRLRQGLIQPGSNHRVPAFSL